MNGEETKIIQFEATFRAHADLKLKLYYNDLRLKDFFNSIIDGYLNNDESLVAFVDNLKEQKLISSLARRSKVQKSHKKLKETEVQFALNDQEIEDIFDIIAREEPTR